MFRKTLRSLNVRGALLLAPWVALAVLAVPVNANAFEFGLKLEPGVAIPLTPPQSDIYDIGGGLSIKAMFGVARFLDIGPVGSFMLLPASKSGAEAGVAWGVGGGLRFKRPHDAIRGYGISPWLDVNGLYVRTGGLNRPGLDAAVGFSVPIGQQRTFWLGPFVRYMHVFQLDRAGYDNRDAKIILAGLSFEVGTGIKRKPLPPPEAPPPVPCAPQEVRVVTKEVPFCADRDNDGVPDVVDHCPDVAGPEDNWGCPVYAKVVIHKDKLELKEKIQFELNKSRIRPVSHPLLNEVTRALKENKGFNVQIEGHASSEGGVAHNQELSEQRAASVLEYLVEQGISRDRLVSKGFGSSVPVESNATSAGREKNRRVEFVVRSINLDDGGVK